MGRKQKNIILFAERIFTTVTNAIADYKKKHKVSYKTLIVLDKKTTSQTLKQQAHERADIVVECDTYSDTAILEALKPYRDQLTAATCLGEKPIPLFQRLIPDIPYLHTPTAKSLEWSVDKLLMRRRLYRHNKKLSPAYTVIKDTTEKSIQRVLDKIRFPLVVKPAGLSASKLVSICYHEDELRQVLRRSFRALRKAYKENAGRGEPKMLVEEFIEGEMYSIDAYVSARGKVYFCPMVNVKTGRSIGFDDFFGYLQTTPTLLNPTSIKAAEDAAKQAIVALGLRNTSAHVELLKTEEGWKIIEVGPRVGGFRQEMYLLSYGFNHRMNDILIRIPEPVIIKRRVKGHTAAMKFFAPKEGTLIKLKGVKKAQELSSFHEINVNKKIGDRCKFAKNGGSSVFNIVLFNKDRSKLLADIRRLEKMVNIETK